MSELEQLELLNKTEQDLNWFNLHYTEIVKKYDNKFVAIKNQEIVAAEVTLAKVISKLNKLKLNPSVTWVGFVSKIKTVL